MYLLDTTLQNHVYLCSLPIHNQQQEQHDKTHQLSLQGTSIIWSPTKKTKKTWWRGIHKHDQIDFRMKQESLLKGPCFCESHFLLGLFPLLYFYHWLLYIDFYISIFTHWLLHIDFYTLAFIHQLLQIYFYT